MQNKKNFRLKLNLPSSWPVGKRKEKKILESVTEGAFGYLYTSTEPVLLSAGAALILFTAQACEVL